MNEANQKLSADDIEALLPWYAAGTLDAREAGQVEAALAISVELARHLDPLEASYCVERLAALGDGALCAAREPVVLSLAQVTPMPLPTAQEKERNAQRNSQSRKQRRLCEYTGANRNTNGQRTVPAPIKPRVWKL